MMVTMFRSGLVPRYPSAIFLRADARVCVGMAFGGYGILRVVLVRVPARDRSIRNGEHVKALIWHWGLSVTDAVRRIAGSVADNVSGVPNGPVRWLLPVIPKGHFKENLQFRPLACGSGHAFNRPLQVLQAWWLSSRKRPYRNLSHLAVGEESRPETNLPGSSGMRGVVPCRGFSLHCIL